MTSNGQVVWGAGWFGQHRAEVLTSYGSPPLSPFPGPPSAPSWADSVLIGLIAALLPATASWMSYPRAT